MKRNIIYSLTGMLIFVLTACTDDWLNNEGERMPDNVLYYQAGAGIVAKSNDERELQEVNNKLGALKKAIDLAEKLIN